MPELGSQKPPAQPFHGPLTADDARRYRNILDSLSDMVFCKSASYQVTFANRATQASIGRELSRMMGGTLSVESALGEGSTFVIELERA